MIEQAAGRGDQNIDAASEFLDLRVDVYAAKYCGRFEPQVTAVGPYALVDLGGQLACGGQYKGAHPRLLQGFGCQHLQNRKRKAGGLSGAGLCAGQKVLALKDDGDGLGLYRGRFGVAGIGHCAYELGTQAERFE